LTEVRLVKLRIKEGKKQRWLEWCEEDKRRSNEVLETLKNEGMISEACFLSEDENFVYYFMESDNFDKVFEAFRNSTFLIDKEHEAIQKETLEFVANLKVLFSFHSQGSA
jgi:L-rhamnose mutarotase